MVLHNTRRPLQRDIPITTSFGSLYCTAFALLCIAVIMPFPFIYLCDLLNDLERPHVSRYPMLPKDLANYTKDKVIRWLRLHRDRLNAFSTDSTAVMAMLQPENQTDRVYGLDSRSLELVIARALQLPRPHYLDLQRWKTEPAQGDLGACVKRVMENMDTVSYETFIIFTPLQLDPGMLVMTELPALYLENA
jgi:hypothetical protein